MKTKMIAVVKRTKHRKYSVNVFNKQEDANAYVLDFISKEIKKFSKQDEYVKTVLDLLSKEKEDVDKIVFAFNEVLYLHRSGLEIGFAEADAPHATKAMLRFMESRELANLI
jgi:hypothetical protein